MISQATRQTYHQSVIALTARLGGILSLENQNLDTLWLAAIALGVFCIFTFHFVVPIMFLRGGTCSQAWSAFGTLLRAHPGKFAWYLLFQIVLNLAKILLLLIAVLCTCCVAGILMVIPYMSAVFLLPVTVFMQSYQLYYLKQFGADFDVFTAVVPPELVKSP